MTVGVGTGAIANMGCMAYTLDNHGTGQKPTGAGIEQPHAEAVVAAISRADSELATKADLERAVNRMLIAQVAIAGLLFTALRLT